MKLETLVLNNIKKRRARLKIRQKHLAKKLNVSQAAISHYETGRNRLNLVELSKIAKVLKTDVGTLMRG